MFQILEIRREDRASAGDNRIWFRRKMLGCVRVCATSLIVVIRGPLAAVRASLVYVKIITVISCSGDSELL